MSDYKQHLKRSLEDSDFEKEWDEQSFKRELMNQIIKERIAQGMTQAELAEACGMKQSNLWRLENGNGNPSVATLEKIAKGLGKKLQISFV